MNSIPPAYLAGFFDGEGYVGLASNTRRTSTRKAPKLSFQPKIAIGQKHPAVLLSIQESLGYGSITRHKTRFGFTYRFRVHNRIDVIRFLEEVLPHVIVKREQVELMLKVLSNKDNLKSSVGQRAFLKLKELKRTKK